MRRLALVLIAVTALAVAGCARDFDRGPAGKVTDKVRKGKKYYLVVDPAKGGAAERFRVSKHDYHDCYRGSKYPQCVDD